MEITEKASLMVEVYSVLDKENYTYEKRAWGTIAIIKEKGYSFEISITDKGKYLMTSNDKLLTYTFDTIGQLFDVAFMLYHCITY